MLKADPINRRFTYDLVGTEAYDDLDLESNMEAIDTEDYVDMERVIRDSGRFFVDDDDPSAFEYDPDLDIDNEAGFEDEGLFGH